MSTVTADASKIIEGGRLMVWVGTQSIACATSHAITLSTESNEISNKDIGSGNWAASSIKRFSWEASSDNMYTISAYKRLFQLMTSKTKVTLTFGVPSSDSLIAGDASTGFADWTWQDPSTGSRPVGDDCTLQGYAYITSLDVQAPNDDNATFSVGFTGTGQLSIL